jgi:autotransporter translocation and assembly factor TamB
LDPASAAQVTWAPLPPAPTPNSTYKVQSIKANSNGTITIVFVPVQGGTATVSVTVPTGTIARNEAIAAKKAKKCKKNQIKLKGKCQPKITTSGKVSATGVAGVPLTLTVKPSGKVSSALKKGKTVHLTATLTYTSALGGVPTVQTFHVTVKGKRKGHKKH